MSGLPSIQYNKGMDNEYAAFKDNLKKNAGDKIRDPHFFSLILESLVIGAFMGFLVWFFFLCFKFGKNLLWPEVIPFGLSLPVYRILVFAVGGVCTGVLQKYWGGYPKGLSTVVELNRRQGSFGFDNIPVVFLSAMVPLIFGSAVGPEASLMSFIATVCCYIGTRIRMSEERLQIFTFVGISSGLGACFKAPLFGFMELIEQPIRLDRDDTIIFPSTKRIIIYLTAIFGSIAALDLLNSWIFVLEGMPRFQTVSVQSIELLWFLPLALCAGLFGCLFPVFSQCSAKLLKPLSGKYIVKALLCSVVMALVMWKLPLTQFTGEEQIKTLMDNYRDYTPLILFLTVFAKMFLTAFCVQSGWKGGHLYPTVFTGIACGFAFALCLPSVNPVFCVAVCAGALSGAVIRKPMATALLLLLCFPINVVVWMFAAAFIGSLIPAGIEEYFGVIA